MFWDSLLSFFDLTISLIFNSNLITIGLSVEAAVVLCFFMMFIFFVAVVQFIIKEVFEEVFEDNRILVVNICISFMAAVFIGHMMSRHEAFFHLFIGLLNFVAFLANLVGWGMLFFFAIQSFQNSVIIIIGGIIGVFAGIALHNSESPGMAGGIIIIIKTVSLIMILLAWDEIDDYRRPLVVIVIILGVISGTNIEQGDFEWERP